MASGCSALQWPPYARSWWRSWRLNRCEESLALLLVRLILACWNILDPECLICGKKIVTDDAIFNFGSIKPDETKSKEIERIIAKGMSKNFLHSGQSDPYKSTLNIIYAEYQTGTQYNTAEKDSVLSVFDTEGSLLQMAEKTTGGLQDVPGSSPDENEFPFGYPTNICEDVPDQKYLCSNCNNILKKALQTLCGHRYCSACLSWIVRNNKNAICQKCKEEDPSTLSEGSLLAEERAFGDAAINKEISELKVHCVTLGCSWSGIMKNFEEHQSLCEYALIPCHTGCGHMVMRKKLADHLENGCVNNVTTCQKCKRSLSSSEYQGSKEKIKEHEKSAVGAHMLLLLQHIKQLKASLCTAAKAANGSIPSSELNVNGAGKSISDLQIPGGLDVNGDLEVDCFPGSSVSEDESVLQQLVREKVISELENKLHVFENIVAVLNKEVETSNLEITAFRRQSELDQNIIRGLELKIAELHRCLTQKDAGLSSLHKSLLFSEQASYDGVFLWKITDVGRKLQDSVTGRTVSLYSPAFYTAKYGYKVCLRVYLNGDGTGKGTHMSLFFVVMRGDYDALLPWPFRHKVTFMLLDQNNREHIIDAFRPDLTSASFQRPVNDMNVASGCPMFLPLSKLQSPKYAYVKEDTLFLKCIIETN
ncbi:PREDICTED: TNF receptor-associated factor 1 [Nipponia nippon]|uniref:TNF receptor-associated factor 1 n=1 Tax=Nipponia nippon TaxID=128390 RepID=UPI0005113C45|nr:PREDICTED: TNF receptor-associated factor 1 [Nipponia nippon]